MLSDRKPGSTFCSRMKLRISSPAPVSSTSDNATSTTTSDAQDAARTRTGAVAAPLAQRVVGHRRGEERRNQSEHQPRCQRRDDRERHDRKIERDLIEPRHRNAIGDERQQAAMKDHRKREAEHTASQRQHHALGQHLPQQPAAVGAERGAKPELALAHRAACEQQIGDVDAGDEQDENDRAREHGQRRLDRLGGERVDRQDDHRTPGIQTREFSFSR